MKIRKILVIAIIAIMFLALFIGTVNAAVNISYQLLLTTKTYTVGQEGTDKPEENTIEEGKTLQLKAYINEKKMTTPPLPPVKPDGDDTDTSTDTGTGSNTVDEQVEVTNTILQEAAPVWRSSDTEVATVNSTGLVTAKKPGTVTIDATNVGNNYQTETLKLKLTITAAPVLDEDFTDFSNVTFKAEDFNSFDRVRITFDNFSPRENHQYSVYITQDSSHIFDINKDYLSLKHSIEKNEKNEYFADIFDKKMASMLTQETKDTYLVVVDQNYDNHKYKMVLGPTKIEKPKIVAELGGGRIESYHFSSESSNFYNRVVIAGDRTITYKFGEITDNNILASIANKETDGFTKLLEYAKTDTKAFATGSFNFDEHIYKTENIAKASGKVTRDKYYYMYTVADTLNGKYMPVEDVVVFNGQSDGTLTHFAFAGSSSKLDKPSGETTKPTTTTGDTTIATKKIPQTGATPVFMIILGSSMLIAVVFVMANKKYRNLK